MYSYFSFFAQNDTNKPLSRDEFKELIVTNGNVFSYYMNENDILSKHCKALISELQPDDLSFDEKFDGYIVGTFIYLSIYAERKSSKIYPLSMFDLQQEVEHNIDYSRYDLDNESVMKPIIEKIGMMALRQKIPFDQKCFDKLMKMMPLSKDISLNTRLAKYFPTLNTEVKGENKDNDAVAASPSAEESKYSRCAIL